MPESEIVVLCQNERVREITRARLGTKPAVTKVTDGEDFSLIVICNAPKLIRAIAERCGAVVASHTAPRQDPPTLAPEPESTEEDIEDAPEEIEDDSEDEVEDDVPEADDEPRPDPNTFRDIPGDDEPILEDDDKDL